MAGRREATQQLAAQVSIALQAADLDAYSQLLHPDVTWGIPDDPIPTCRSRADVLSWYRRAREAGARARVVETTVLGDKILVGLRVTGNQVADTPGDEADRWQVLTVRDGQIADIAGFADRSEALARAGAAPPGWQPPESPRWDAPSEPLGDEHVTVRLPESADAETLHAYAIEPGGLDGGWIPLPDGVSVQNCAALVRDWQAGWENAKSFHGPAFVITAPGSSRLIGQVGLAGREAGVVELVYGVAPDWRRSGFATRAVRLVAGWLLETGQASQVELQIDADNTASQRVATAAGFGSADPVTSDLHAAGDTYEDLRFVLPPPG